MLYEFTESNQGQIYIEWISYFQCMNSENFFKQLLNLPILFD